MEEIYTKIQVYLIKKDKECERLRFLTSRTTPANDANVSDVCQTIKAILKDSATSSHEQIQYFKFLMLNTKFRAQEHLCEDIANGHLVDMCPPLSPFLFIEILWAVNYEDIMCDSVLYIPVDLCSQMINALRRSLDVDFQRGFITALKVAANCYKKLISMMHRDTQVLEQEESLKYFIGSIQELLSLLGKLQSKKVEHLSETMKYERSGWVLIRLLNTTKECFAARRARNLPPIYTQELDKLYAVTFARNFTVRLDPDAVEEAVDLVSKELVDLLLANVKKIDCYVYMGWAELDYAEDTSISMQRAVGLACYHFVEFLEAEERPEDYSHLVECLTQLSSKPDAPCSMSLRELCVAVEKGNKECLKKLIERFEEWDSAAISCLDKNRELIDRRVCLSLLNGAVKYLDTYPEGELCPEVYNIATKILLGQKLVDLVEIVVEFVLIHNASRALESMNFELDLKSYVNQGLALCSSKTSLRIILYFVVQNPREVLNTLIRAAIGYPEYANSMISPEDFCKLSALMQIRDSNKCSLLSNSLRVVLAENVAWNGKKFLDLTRVLLNKKLILPDELINDTFIPVLKNDVILANIQPILTCIRNVRDDLTPKLKRRELLYVLALQMASLRKNADLSIYVREEMLDLLIRIVRHFAKINVPIENGADSFIERLEAGLEPLDKIYFAPQWGWIRDDVSIVQVLQDYKKRCYLVMDESDPSEYYITDIDSFLETYGLETGDFLEHLLSRCTEFEYLKFAKEVLLIHWNYFGWENELHAYAQFSLATIKACRNVLNSLETIQKFASLIQSLAKLTTWFISIDVMSDYESVHKSLVSAMMSLNLNSTQPDFPCPYQELKESSSQLTSSDYSYETVADLVDKVDKFGDRFLHRCSQPDKGDGSIAKLQFDLKSAFISMCLGWPLEEKSLLLSKIDKRLYSNDWGGVETYVRNSS